jgi:nucleoside diphosphate kinase
VVAAGATRREVRVASELAFALINPYTIAKSRTGGVIGRLMSRTGLNLVAARMFGPSQALVDRYGASFNYGEGEDRDILAMIADYVKRCYSPDAATGRPRRVMLLLFEGENAIQKVREATGRVRAGWVGGETIRDTYGDFVVDEQGRMQYFEPAVLVAPTPERAATVLRLWAEYSESDGGMVEHAADVPTDEGVQKTLVLIKPDNFRIPSLRAGNIIDLLSRAGLRIIGIKKFSMTVAEAEEFYAPVRQALREKYQGIAAQRAGKALKEAFGFEISEDLKKTIGDELGPICGDSQFEQLIRFMTGVLPCECAEEDKVKAGSEECLALAYKGMSAVEKIRYLLGPTDPSQAQPGSVRREFGSDIMVNAAHASDSPENALRELKIVRVEEDTITAWVSKYYGSE